MITDLERLFKYHAPTPEKVDRHDRIRAALLDAATAATRLCPQSPEYTLGIRKLEEAMFWFNAAIARQP